MGLSTGPSWGLFVAGRYRNTEVYPSGGNVKSNRFLAIGVKLGLVVALIAGVSGGCSGTVADVSVERVGPRSIKASVMVAGSLTAANPTQVMPKVSGSVAQVYAEDGQEVAAGQPLLQLDTSSLEQSLLSAQASLESIQSISGLFASVSQTASSIGGAFRSVLASVDAGVTSLVSFEQSIVPCLPEEYRLQALQSIDRCYNDYLAKRQNVPQVSMGGGGMSTGAQQAAAAKSIENARKNLDSATITAPVAGTVISSSGGGQSMESLIGTLMSSFSGMIPSGLSLSSLTGMSGGLGSIGFPSSGQLVAGSYIAPGSPVFTIVDLKNMSMLAKVDETDIAKVEAGQSASVSLEAYPDKEFSGTVVKVANTATTNEAGATAFEVTIQMEPSDTNLKIGMSGTADVVVATKQAVVVVPIDAVVDKKQKKYVYKVVDGKASLTEVRIGLSTDSDVEITSGLKAGDMVVVKGIEKLKDGQSVKQ